MAYIPGGRYQMLKRKRDSTDVAPFCMDTIEVTVAAYKICVREGKCTPECLLLGQCSAVPTQASWGDPQEAIRASAYCNGDRDDRQDHPVNCVSWEESTRYCEAYGKRLPTAEEWEWAARGANPEGWYPWGTGGDVKDQLCWSKPDVRGSTCVSASNPTDKTPQGLYDMAGNVSEWVSGSLAAPGVHRPARQAFGASWYAMDDGYVRASLGGVEVPSERNETLGFRCAKNAPASGEHNNKF
jgi:formylglycine-generating enzyme required for sulfatase activity